MSVEVRGLDVLHRKLERLDKKARRDALRPAMRQAANLVRDEARQRVPRRTGLLRKNIITNVKIDAKGAVAKVRVRSKAFYGRFVELGTKFLPARPFLRPALDQKAQAAVNEFAAVLRKALLGETR